jgi:C4-type Zn-finger protein
MKARIGPIHHRRPRAIVCPSCGGTDVETGTRVYRRPHGATVLATCRCGKCWETSNKGAVAAAEGRRCA